MKACVILAFASLSLCSPENKIADKLEKAEVLENAAHNAWRDGRYNEALSKFGEAENIYYAADAIGQLVDVLRWQGVLFRVTADFDSSFKYLTRARTLCEKSYGKSGDKYARIIFDIGKTHSALSQYDEAFGFYDQAMDAVLEKGDKSRQLIADIARSMGHALNSQQKTIEALDLYEKVFSIHQKIYPDDHFEISVDLYHIGSCLLTLGLHERALQAFNEMMRIDKKSLAWDHPVMATNLERIGGALREAEKYELSLEAYYSALEIYKETHGVFHPSISKTLNNLSFLLSRIGKHEEALKALEQALVINDKVYPDGHLGTAIILKNLGRKLASKKKHKKALAHFERALEIQTMFLDENDDQNKELRKRIRKVKRKV